MDVETSLSREERYAEYLEMGLSLRDIARREDIDYASVQKWASQQGDGE